MKKYLMNIVLVFSFLGLLNAQNENLPKMYVNATLLNLRSEPSLDSRIVEQLKIKDVVEFQYKTIYTERINKREGTWVKIKTNHNEGFVFDYYLEYPIKLYDSVKGIVNIDDKFCYSVSHDKSKYLNRIYESSYFNVEQISNPYVVFSSVNPIVKNRAYRHVITKGLIKEGSEVEISNVLDSLNNDIGYSLKLLVSNGYAALYLNRFTSSILGNKNKNVISRTQIKLSDTILSSESIELVWHGDINGDSYPDLILNVTSETLSTQFFVVSSGTESNVFYSEWDKQKVFFKTCF